MNPSKIRRARWRACVTVAWVGTLSVLGPSRLAADFDDPDELTLEEKLRLVDDAEIKQVFEKALQGLMEAGKTGDPEDIRRQLTTRRSCKVELPTPTIGIPLLPEDVFGATRGSVLCLGSLYNCGKCEHWHVRPAGGVVLTEDGLAVTNYHVMAREDAAVYGAMNDSGDVFPITEVLAASKETDLAIVRLGVESAVKGQLVGSPRPAEEDAVAGSPEDEADLLTPAILSLDDPVGSQVWVISHPNGHYFSLTSGIISRYHRNSAKNGASQPIRVSITADFARGSSGGGVFNRFGKLSSLVASTKSIYYSNEDGEARNLQMVVKDCIPARHIRDLIEEPGDE